MGFVFVTGLRISNCFSFFTTPVNVFSDGMGAAHTARMRERSEAKARARCMILKYMIIVVRRSSEWASSTEWGGCVVERLNGQLEVL